MEGLYTETEREKTILSVGRTNIFWEETPDYSLYNQSEFHSLIPRFFNSYLSKVHHGIMLKLSKNLFNKSPEYVLIEQAITELI